LYLAALLLSFSVASHSCTFGNSYHYIQRSLLFSAIQSIQRFKMSPLRSFTPSLLWDLQFKWRNWWSAE